MNVFINLPVADLERSRAFFAALGHGADEPRGPMDYGFMYARIFTDPDGHIWEPFWLDLEAALAAGAPDDTTAATEDRTSAGSDRQ